MRYGQNVEAMGEALWEVWMAKSMVLGSHDAYEGMGSVYVR